ncbi:UbiA family prenyltransferase [Adhaeribacter aquaticus]|uniref:UbiA family prenyltransferase n=1 Tax=Adhaeribacter aquaticus TaxID=299567 RepID=UPI0012F993F1|nr:UbiA family prenyltransferase [Adhaeribacter aquaticus]
MPWELGGWVFLATFFLYNFDSLSPIKLHQPVLVSERKRWVIAHRKQLVFFVIIAGIAILLIFYVSFRLSHFWLLAHLGFISLFYSLPIIPLRKKVIPLRDIPLLKIFLIAYVWASVTVWLPLLAADWPISAREGWLLFMQRFFFLLPLTIIFDIRDVERDRTTATLTLPGLVGIKWAKVISFLILLLYIFIVIAYQTGPKQYALLLCGMIYGLVIAVASEKKGDYFYALVADGIMILQFLFLWMAANF